MTEAAPYQPSWISRFLAWVDRLPVSGLLFYMLVYGAFVLLTHLTAWLDGHLTAGAFNSNFAFDMIWVPFGLGYIHLMERAADRSIKEFRPALTVSDEEYAGIAYRFTTLPALPVLGLTLLGLAIGMYEVLGLRTFLRPEGRATLFRLLPGACSLAAAMRSCQSGSTLLFGTWCISTSFTVRWPASICSTFSRYTGWPTWP